jgi:hypothetical protein
MSEKSIESDMEFDNTPPEITNMLLLRVHGRGENTVRYSDRMRIALKCHMIYIDKSQLRIV